MRYTDFMDQFEGMTPSEIEDEIHCRASEDNSFLTGIRRDFDLESYDY